MTSRDRGLFRPDIQALRGAAVLAVVVFHAGLPLPGGFVGVDVFFVVSGYVITGLLLRELESSGRVGFASFYARRARRLLPSLAVNTVVVLALSIALLPPATTQPQVARTAMATSLYGANLFLYRFGVEYFAPGTQNPFLHMWSLGVEEQVYLVLPVTIAFLWTIGRRFHRPRAAVSVGLLALSVLSLAVCVALTYERLIPLPLAARFAFYSPVTRLWEFGFGALVANRVATGAARRAAGFRAVAGLILVGVSALVFSDTTAFPGLAALLPVVGTCIVIQSAVGLPALQAKLAPRWLVWLGDNSYGWYLWHWPLVVLSRFTWEDASWVALPASAAGLVVAVVVRRMMEDPIRFTSSIVGVRAFGLALLCAVVPFASAVAFREGAARGWGNSDLRSTIAAQAPTQADVDRCDSLLRTEPCHYPVGRDSDAPRLLLVGDSHAAAVADVVAQITSSSDISLDVWTRGNCPFLRDTAFEHGCDAWSADVWSWIESDRPDVVVISVYGLKYAALMAEGGTGADGTRAGVERYVTGLGNAVDAARAAGAEVVILGDVPVFPGSSLERATLLRPRPAPQSLSRSEVEAQLDELGVAMRSIEGDATLVDPLDALCTADECSQRRDGQWIYRDSNHVSVLGALLLRPALAEAILRAC